MEGETLLNSTWFWTIVCLFLCAAGGLMLWAISKVPGIGWTVYPPSLRQLREMAMRAPVPRSTPGRD